jgi:hypothetical protein
MICIFEKFQFPIVCSNVSKKAKASSEITAKAESSLFILSDSLAIQPEFNLKPGLSLG